MPPRARKLDPEALKKAFDDWKDSEEYNLWKTLAEEILKKQEQYKFKDLDIVPDVYNDLQKEFQEDCKPWQLFLDDLFKFTKLLKVKTKLKEYKFEWWRGCQFARFKDINTKETIQRPYIIDNVSVTSIKEAADEAGHARENMMAVFKDIVKILETDADERINENNFQQIKKTLQKSLSEFNKYLIKYSLPKNKFHADVYEDKIQKVLDPLTQLLNCNARLSYFEFAYKTPQERQAASFKEKILISNFCNAYQNFQKVLHEIEQRKDNRVIAPIEMQRVINKFNYEDWLGSKPMQEVQKNVQEGQQQSALEDQKNYQEEFYLKPLKIIYFKLRKNMCQLHSKGIDYWRAPMGDNSYILKDVQQLVDAELIAENLLGNNLKRDQLSFTFEVLKLIKNSPAKEKLLAKDSYILQYTIPELIIFKTLQKMRHILNLKIEEIEEQQKQEQQLQASTLQQQGQQQLQNDSKMKVSYFEEKVKQVEDQLNKSFMKASMLLSPQKSQYFSSPPSPTKGKQQSLANFEDDETKEQRELDAEVTKYGRFWLWETYIDPKYKDDLLDGAEQLRHIHYAIQQDVQDWIITLGYKAKDKKQQQEEKKKKHDMERKHDQDKKEVENKEIAIYKRPPELWNHPDVEIEDEKEHKFRQGALPKQSYKDKRVSALYDNIIKKLGEHIYSYNHEHWKELISRTIDIFNDTYNEKPNENLDDEKPNYNLKKLKLNYEASALAQAQAQPPAQQQQQAQQ